MMQLLLLGRSNLKRRSYIRKYVYASVMGSRKWPGWVLGAFGLFAASCGGATNTGVGFLPDVIASIDSTGVTTSQDSTHPTLSRDGSIVTFVSAGTLVPEDTNQVGDIYLFERKRSVTTLISINTDGTPADGPSENPHVSGNGMRVVFESTATNLVAGDNNQKSDIFLRDLETQETTRISIGFANTESAGNSTSPSISNDGRFISFVSDATNLLAPGEKTTSRTDIFVYDTRNGTTQRVAPLGTTVATVEPSGPSFDAEISADGRYVAYTSTANNIVVGIDPAGIRNVFRWDRLTGDIILVSVGPASVPADLDCFNPHINDDGNFIVFDTASAVMLGPINPRLNLLDNNAASDVFRRDVKRSITQRADRTPGEDPAGRSDPFPGDAFRGWISGDGSLVIYQTDAPNLLNGGNDDNGSPDIYLTNMNNGVTVRVSVQADGSQVSSNALLPPDFPVISADGTAVAFQADSRPAIRLGSKDGVVDIFVLSP